MKRPIPGAQTINYRKSDGVFQRCSRCRRETQLSSLVLSSRVAAPTELMTIMVGVTLVGLLCSECEMAMVLHIQSIFPDRHGFPFVDVAGQLMPNPTCENGHALVYTDDGRHMACEQCDVTPVLPEPSFIGPVSD